MARDYDDYDRRDDFDRMEDDDEARDNDREAFDDRRGARVIARAKRSATAPGICLIILGVICCLNGIYGLIIDIDQQWQDQANAMQADPNQTAAQKKQMKDMMDTIGKYYVPFVKINSAIGTVTSLLTILAGICMRKLKARSLCYAGTILCMIPLMSTCCLLGFPLGIWALIVLGRPEVTSGFAAVARSNS